MNEPIIIGTRGSPLALVQAEAVRAHLLAAHPHLAPDDIRLEIIKTSGDRILDRHLMLAGGKGLFTKEIEEAMLEGRIHCAVHSCKDMPTKLPAGLALVAWLKREDPRDAFMSENYACFEDLPEGARVGTASLRRRAQALRLRPDLQIETLRGNVQTRMQKLADGLFDATFLAAAGLNRLGLASHVRQLLSLDDFLPAPAQGVVVVEAPLGNSRMIELLKPLHSAESFAAAEAERAFLAALDGSCRTPIAAYSRLEGDVLHFRGQILGLSGERVYDRSGTCGISEAAQLGRSLGESIRTEAGQGFFDALAREAEAVVTA